MPAFRKLSLGQLLTVPYVALSLMLTLILGALSYHSGRTSVDSLSSQLLSEKVNRIAQAVEMNVLRTAGTVLETAFPAGVKAPEHIHQQLDPLRLRFWQATSVQGVVNNYAYYGDQHGDFFGMWRYNTSRVQMRLRLQGEEMRKIYGLEGIDGEPSLIEVEKKAFDPRERPWYKMAVHQEGDQWSPVYVDFRLRKLVATRARRVLNAQQEVQGVVATDVGLEQLSEFLRQLPISPQGFAFIEEADGNLIATSRGDSLSLDSQQRHQRLKASDSPDRVLAEVHGELRQLMTRQSADQHVQSTRLDMSNGEVFQVAYARIRDSAGLDWVIAVAVPHEDFLHDITQSSYQSLFLGLSVAAVMVLVGVFSLHSVSRDLHKVAVAAKGMGEGNFDIPLNIRRTDEIGEMAESFKTMREKLATDRLTGLSNREAMVRRMESRILLHRRDQDDSAFALLFLDVDGFKAVNDQHGHDVGDQVLRALGRRMLQVLRDSDKVARWAGDEFLILLPGVNHAAMAQPVIEKLKVALAEPLDGLLSVPCAIEGVSIGLAVYPQDGQDVTSLVASADADMYRQKGLKGRQEGQARSPHETGDPLGLKSHDFPSV